jgi:hypothetical protein
MSFTRRIGVALAIAGSGLTAAASAPRVYSPGYTYRLKIDGRVVEKNGRPKSFVVISGHATVSEKGGRLDVDEASKEQGAAADKGAYFLYDPASMMIVSPTDKRILKISFEDLDQGISAPAANVPSTRMSVSDVVVSVEELGPGAPMLGMSTKKYQITSDYELASADRSSTEHVVQDVWVADEKKGLANPFVRMGQLRIGAGSSSGELLKKTAEAERTMGRGIVLRTVTSTTSMLSRTEVTQSVTTMEVTDLQPAEIDDALLTAPADYQLTDISAQRKAAIAAQLEQAKASQLEETKAQAAAAAKPASPPTAKAAPKAAPKDASTDAAAEAKQGFVKTLHGMGRRP